MESWASHAASSVHLLHSLIEEMKKPSVQCFLMIDLSDFTLHDFLSTSVA
jgi:hypothetical protein